MPAHIPTVTFSQQNSKMTSRLDAPSARRMPISRRRSMTATDVTEKIMMALSPKAKIMRMISAQLTRLMTLVT